MFGSAATQKADERQWRRTDTFWQTFSFSRRCCYYYYYLLLLLLQCHYYTFDPAGTIFSAKGVHQVLHDSPPWPQQFTQVGPPRIRRRLVSSLRHCSAGQCRGWRFKLHLPASFNRRIGGEVPWTGGAMPESATDLMRQSCSGPRSGLPRGALALAPALRQFGSRPTPSLETSRRLDPWRPESHAHDDFDSAIRHRAQSTSFPFQPSSVEGREQIVCSRRSTAGVCQVLFYSFIFYLFIRCAFSWPPARIMLTNDVSGSALGCVSPCVVAPGGGVSEAC